MTHDPLEVLVHGRLDAVHVTPETGLVSLTVWCPGGARRLGVGVGPRVVGVGWLPKSPLFHAGSRHPLIALMKARAVGQVVRGADLDDDGAVWITLGEDRVELRVRLFPALAGEVRVLDGAGVVLLTWHGERKRPPRVCEPVGDFEAVGDELSRTSDALAAELRRGALLRGLRAHAKKLVRRVEAVEHDLARIDDVARLQRTGRMLLAQGAKIPRGASRAVLDDWETGETLEVALDPARPAKTQAEGFFTKAKRLQRGEAMMWARLTASQQGLDATRALEAEVDAAETVTHALLQRWLESARALGLREHETAPGRGRSKQAPRAPFIEYVSGREQRILVGRGAADNDRLTGQVARPHDVWMHARGVSGAHVVVPLERGSVCPPDVLVDAATLATHHSDARGTDFVEVTWPERRYVRKPRKSPPGKVVVDRERVLALRPEPERLARLLASRRET